MSTLPKSLHDPANVSGAVPAQERLSIFVDLDGTLIWTWEPLITTAFMSQVFGLPICTPPKESAGYMKLSKVPIGTEGKFTLTCPRPGARMFLRALRRLGSVYLLTHATRQYALAMNAAFKFEFTEDQIFAVREDFEVVRAKFGESETPVVLIDDEGPGSRRAWGKRGERYYFRDDRADMRHQAKCRCVGVVPNSRRDIAIPIFAGRKNDLFRRASFRRSILQRVRKALKVGRPKGAR